MKQEVKQAVLIDPVSLLLCLPNTQYAFLYRRPQGPKPNDIHSKTPRTPTPWGPKRLKQLVLDYALHYVVATELTVRQ